MSEVLSKLVPVLPLLGAVAPNPPHGPISEVSQPHRRYHPLTFCKQRRRGPNSRFRGVH